MHNENTKQFFTPEEFEGDWQRFVNVSRRGGNFKEFKIVNPMYAIRLCSRWVDIANRKLQEVIEKYAPYAADFKKK